MDFSELPPRGRRPYFQRSASAKLFAFRVPNIAFGPSALTLRFLHALRGSRQGPAEGALREPSERPRWQANVTSSAFALRSIECLHIVLGRRVSSGAAFRLPRWIELRS